MCWRSPSVPMVAIWVFPATVVAKATVRPSGEYDGVMLMPSRSDRTRSEPVDRSRSYRNGWPPRNEV